MRSFLRRSTLAASLLLSAAAARAADPASPLTFGTKGQATLGAERLFGLEHASIADGGSSFTTLRLLSASGYELAGAPYSVPRLAFDYFVADRWSLGLGAGLASTSPEHGSAVTSIVLNPRVGYAAPVGERVTFWPMAGFNYVHLDAGSGSSAYYLAATLEAKIVAAIAPHFGIQAGAALDLGAGAGAGNGATAHNVTQFGLECGLTGWW